ncbi:hypothetical protein INT45_006573 [Circinella minor]|uniref:Uncharacterized protein n=1 Tax=Circinella minor TaxID=1195481 RepID=A0A8H7VNV9_9FUNG|nr:hypothetical protein INT45_006573 [Circinella minor]
MSQNPSDRLTDLFKDYFKRTTEPPSLAGFYAYDPENFVQNSPELEAVAFWTKEFKKAIKYFDIKKSTNRNPNWSAIFPQELNVSKYLSSNNSSGNGSNSANLEEAEVVTTPKPKATKRKTVGSTTVTDSSKGDSCPLTDEAREHFKKAFDDMNDDNKWELRKENNKRIFVEDIMYEFGMKCEYEHAVHSFILDLNDTCWNSYFTIEEKKALFKSGNWKLPPIDPEIREILDNHALSVADLVGSEEEEVKDELLDCLWTSITKQGYYNPKQEFDKYWIQQALVSFLDMYRLNKLKEIVYQGSEMDFVIQCWSKFDRCFDDLGVVGRFTDFWIKKRDRTCLATLVRVNAQRTISGAGPIESQHRSVRPDILIMKDGIEVAVGETAKLDVGGVTKKELVEKSLHLPKVMKDLYNVALAKGKNKESLARVLRIVAMNQINTRIQISILDCPKGYVSRLLRLEEDEIPLDSTLITSSLFGVIKSVLVAKAIVKNNLQQIKAHQLEIASSSKKPSYAFECDLDDNDDNEKYLILPQALTLPNKKQKKN